MNELDVNLFAGAGGLARGLRLAGFNPTILYENDANAWETLRHNKLIPSDPPAWEKHKGDVKQVRWQDFERRVRLLAGGVPCQPFSLGGKHLADRDDRNLFPQLLRAIRHLTPKAVLVENVQGFLREGFEPYFRYILRRLEIPSMKPKSDEVWKSHDKRLRREQCSAGYQPEYNVVWRLLEAADYGVPQNRRRIFIVATRNDLPVYRFPPLTHSRDALIRSQVSGEYWLRYDLPKPRRNGTRVQAEQDSRKPWLTVRDALAKLPEPADEEEEAEMNHWSIPGARAYTGHDGSKLDWTSKTIKAGVHGVSGGENTIIDERGRLRYYTLSEMARLQTFPNSHVFHGARSQVIRQIGNAVPPRLAAAVARPLYRLLTHETS